MTNPADEGYLVVTDGQRKVTPEHVVFPLKNVSAIGSEKGFQIKTPVFKTTVRGTRFRLTCEHRGTDQADTNIIAVMEAIAKARRDKASLVIEVLPDQPKNSKHKKAA